MTLAEMASLNLPSLYLQASEDIVVPSSAAATFANFAQRARVEVVAGPHCLLQCAAQPAAKVVEEFMSTVQNGV